MNKIRTIIVDDEPLAIEGLKLRLDAHGDIDVIANCPNGRQALAAIKEHKPDLVLLDIQMPGLDGFAVVRSLIGSYMPQVVFVTAFDEYALAAFESHALDYLLKPVEEERLASALQKVRDQLLSRNAIEQHAKLVGLIEGMQNPPEAILSAILEEKSAPQTDVYERHINIKDRGIITRVDIDDISYVDAAGDYMCIHTPAKTHILRATMKAMTKRLNPKKFQRVHRSTIVNLDKVRELHPHTNGEYFLILENDEEVKVSRSYKEVIGRFA